jgi:beta-glucosidase
MESRIEKLLTALTIDEKARAPRRRRSLAHRRGAAPRHRHAARHRRTERRARAPRSAADRTSACFPCGAALGADVESAPGRKRWPAALAEEALAKGARTLLAPTVNMQRSPLGGRTFECYAEEPHLSSRLAVAFVQGLQARGVGACVKHFVGNDVEWERMRASAEIDERALREVYLAPFEAAVREAGAWTVMGRRYNRLLGAHCTEHERLLTTKSCATSGASTAP